MVSHFLRTEIVINVIIYANILIYEGVLSSSRLRYSASQSLKETQTKVEEQFFSLFV